MNQINIDSNTGFEYLIVCVYSNKFKMVFMENYQLANNKRLTLLKNNNDLFNVFMCKVPKFLRLNSKMEVNTIYIILNKNNLNI